MKTMPHESRQTVLLAAWVVCAVFVSAGQANAASISGADMAVLVAQCSPGIPANVIEAVALTESDNDPWALHDNTTGQALLPDSLDSAQASAVRLMGQGDSVDVGLMQINSRNLSALGLTATGALDPCSSLAGGAAVLRAAFSGGDTAGAQQEVALLLALSRYNTGTPFKGILNGYARTVMQNGAAESALGSPVDPAPHPSSDPNKPPVWNIWANAAYGQTHNAPWLISVPPPPMTSTKSAPPISPMLAYAAPAP
jgi:type IV secretion system protein VirB1